MTKAMAFLVSTDFALNRVKLHIPTRFTYGNGSATAVYQHTDQRSTINTFMFIIQYYWAFYSIIPVKSKKK